MLEGYKSAFPRALGDAMRAKLGLTGKRAPEALREDDWLLVEDLLQLLAAERTDYTIFWRRLSQAMAAGDWTLDAAGSAWQAVEDLFVDRARWQAWRERYRQRVGDAPPAALGTAMLGTNPKFVLRNHLAEIAIRQARDGDFSEIDRLLHLLHTPFDEHPDMEGHAGFPPDWAGHLEISCSS